MLSRGKQVVINIYILDHMLDQKLKIVQITNPFDKLGLCKIVIIQLKCDISIVKKKGSIKL